MAHRPALELFLAVTRQEVFDYRLLARSDHVAPKVAQEGLLVQTQTRLRCLHSLFVRERHALDRLLVTALPLFLLEALLVPV